jgi:hypothetical protein
VGDIFIGDCWDFYNFAQDIGGSRVMTAWKTITTIPSYSDEIVDHLDRHRYLSRDSLQSLVSYLEGRPTPSGHPDLVFPADSEPPADFFQLSRRQVMFPPPTGININMMPIRLGDPSSIPEQCHGYLPIIELCAIMPFDRMKIGYLTIQEGLVTEGTTQRRPGLHTDRHTSVLPNAAVCELAEGEGIFPGETRPLVFHWGGRKGGIYLASSVENSTRVWNAFVKKPGLLGDCEYLRPYLGQGTLVPERGLVWMTDGTPHEALPLTTTQYRQFFRLVTSKVDVWYAPYSTPNPLGIQPPPSVIVVDTNKFTCISLFYRLYFALRQDGTL